MLRRLRNALIVLAALLVVTLSALTLIAKHYEPEVKARLVEALNERLVAPVSMGDIDLTLVARFPKASLRLREVLAMEVRTDGIQADTLLYAEELHLEFSIWGLFRGDYTVEALHGARVRLYPALDKRGYENHLIWKTDSTSTASTVIALEKVSFDGLDVRYRDHRDGTEVRTRSEDLALSGRFGGDLGELALAGDMWLAHWAHGTDTLLRDRQAHLRLNLAFGGEDGAFRITKGEVSTGGVPLELSLEMLPDKGGHHLDLRASGLGLDLAAVLALLPDYALPQLGRYAIKGSVDLAIRLTGPAQGEGPALSLGAAVTNGRVREKRSGTSFTDVQGELALDLTPKGVPRKLVVKGFSAKNGSGTLGGNWASNGLINAEIKADMRVDLALADLLRFAGVDTLEQVGGRLRADASAQGTLRDVADLRPADLRALRINGTIALRDASLKLKGVRHRVEHLDADLAVQGNDAKVQGLKLEFQGSPITLSGTLRNLVPHLLFADQRLTIEARGSSPRIDLGALLTSEPGEGTVPGGGDYTLTLPATIELDLQARVEELVFEDFRATAINATVRMRDRVLRVSPMTFNTASGAVLGSLELDARGPAGLPGQGYPLAIDATFKEIDIKELFREFRDFGQDFIGHRHLSGRSQARVAFRAPLSPALELDMDRLVCTIDIAIDNGAIKDHKPLLDVADHLRKNKLVSPFVDTKELRSRLADARFARLENRIEIRDGAVHIPAMTVRSNALDIELSGTHWFDDRIDHRLNFRLADLFRLGKADDEFGPVVDDGTGMRIFLRMHGTSEDPLFSNDGAMAAARRKGQFQREKQELKSILSDDLGIFRGKSAPPPPAKEQPKALVRVEWDTKGDSTRNARGQDAPDKPKKGLGRLLDKTKEQEERERFKVED